MKSSKQKQNLYNKFLKLTRKEIKRTKEIEIIYKAYENLFETIRKNLKEPITLNYFKK